jgi:hypothetical protein
MPGNDVARGVGFDGVKDEEAFFRLVITGRLGGGW